MFSSHCSVIREQTLFNMLPAKKSIAPFKYRRFATGPDSRYSANKTSIRAKFVTDPKQINYSVNGGLNFANPRWQTQVGVCKRSNERWQTGFWREVEGVFTFCAKEARNFGGKSNESKNRRIEVVPVSRLEGKAGNFCSTWTFPLLPIYFVRGRGIVNGKHKLFRFLRANVTPVDSILASFFKTSNKANSIWMCCVSRTNFVVFQQIKPRALFKYFNVKLTRWNRLNKNIEGFFLIYGIYSAVHKDKKAK